MIMIAICLVAGLVTYALFIAFRRKNIDFTDKKILIIGGTSGLGLSLAKILVSLRAKVVVASRSQRNTVPGTEYISIDMRDPKTYESLGSVYDYIFCCAGSSRPGYFKDLEPNDYLDQMLLNYIGPVSILHHLCKYNKKPFSYVLVSSTAALFTFPGYSAYSPSKCALKSFYETANLELKKEGVDLYIYYPTSMNTAGFDQENTIKPDFTKSIEGMEGLSPDDAALILLAGMSHSHEIYSDLFTRLFAHDMHICKLSDIFYVSIAFFVCPIAKLYVKYKFNNSSKA